MDVFWRGKPLAPSPVFFILTLLISILVSLFYLTNSSQGQKWHSAHINILSFLLFLLVGVTGTDHLVDGGKKDATFISSLFDPWIQKLDPDSTRIDCVFFDGASNVQKAGQLLAAKYPRIHVQHCAMQHEGSQLQHCPRIEQAQALPPDHTPQYMPRSSVATSLQSVEATCLTLAYEAAGAADVQRFYTVCGGSCSTYGCDLLTDDRHRAAARCRQSRPRLPDHTYLQFQPHRSRARVSVVVFVPRLPARFGEMPDPRRTRQ